MKKDDWKGLGVSFGLHLLLLVAFALIASTPQPQPLGMIEVEFGPFEMAQPAARAETPRPTPQQVQPERQPQPAAQRAQPQRTQPVNTPQTRQAPAEEQIPPPRPEPTPPQPETQQQQQQVAEAAQTDRTGGTPEGRDGTTSEVGETGDAATRRAPFSVEGLNRTPQVFPLPRNPGARGTAIIAVCVGPEGGVTSARPAIRTGTPSLDNAALQAVRQWRFNALPPAAPQSEQCGRVTFNFTLN